MCIKRWTEELIEEARRLRFEERLTIQEIGDRFGVSRERIRQVIGNTKYVRNKKLITRKTIGKIGMKFQKEILARRFRSHIQIDDETGCWNWTGASNGKEYSRMYYFRDKDNKSMIGMSPRKYAHFLKYGKYPDIGTNIWYSCKNKKCCNPDHERIKT
jgi:transcriptional regulator with XRE-family HTH domain